MFFLTSFKHVEDNFKVFWNIKQYATRKLTKHIGQGIFLDVMKLLPVLAFRFIYHFVTHNLWVKNKNAFILFFVVILFSTLCWKSLKELGKSLELQNKTEIYIRVTDYKLSQLIQSEDSLTKSQFPIPQNVQCAWNNWTFVWVCLTIL